MTHSASPWSMSDAVVKDANGYVVAFVSYRMDGAHITNGMLMTAAPEMRAALLKVRKRLEVLAAVGNGIEEELEAVNAALAKAGERR